MKFVSVSQIKRGCHGVSAGTPREGTRLRKAWDLFVQNRGIPVQFSTAEYPKQVVLDLQNYYGLDIRRLERGLWVLAGEWFGKSYVDYIAAVVEGEAA